MIDRNTVVSVLQKCSGYANDRTPNPSEMTILSWVEHFGLFPHLTADDVLFAVAMYYRDPRDRMVQPADISKFAREIHQDVRQRWVSDPDETVDEIRAAERNRQRLDSMIEPVVKAMSMPPRDS